MTNDDPRGAFEVDSDRSDVFTSDGSGGSYPFNEAGHIIIQPRTNLPRDAIIAVRTSDAQTQFGLRVISNEGGEPDVVVGNEDVAPGSDTGFLFLPATTGAPSGTPGNHGNGVPVLIDSSSGTLYLHTGGSWDPVSGAAGAHTNVGAGVGLFQENAAGTTELRSLLAGDGISISIEPGDDEVRIAADEANIDHGSIGGLADDDHPQYQLRSEKGAANGYASLDSGGLVPTAQLPQVAFTDVHVVADIPARDALSVQEGDVAKVLDDGTGEANTYIYDGSSWVELSVNDAVDSVNGQTGTVSLDTDDIPEGSNLYFTDERVDDRVAALIVAGTQLTSTYDDVAGTLTLDVQEGAGSGLDADLLDGEEGSFYLARANHTGTQAASTISDFDEAVDDRVAVLIQDGTGISWAYDDGLNTLTPTVSLSPFSTSDLSEGSNLYYTDERVDDRVAALIIGGNQLTATYDDVAGTLTLDVDDGSGSGLDADTVDGLQASQFLRSDASDTTTGRITTTFGRFRASSTSPGVEFDETDTTDKNILMVLDGSNFQWQQRNDALTTVIATPMTLEGIGGSPVLKVAGQKVWTQGNDGAGSGLDADLLDGSEGSFYLARANHTGTQTASTISDFDEAVDDRVAGLLDGGAGLTATYNDAGDTLILDVGAGTGISVAADSVAVDTAAAFTWSGAHTFDAGVTLGTFTEGSIPYIGAGGALSEDNSKLFWDDGNNRLIIGGVGSSSSDAPWTGPIAVPTNDGGVVFESANIATSPDQIQFILRHNGSVVELGNRRTGLGLISGDAVNATLTSGGQLQVPTAGSIGGILIGGDAQLYRDSANVLRTPDSLTVDGTITGDGSGLTSVDADLLDGVQLAGTGNNGPTWPVVPLLKSDGVIEVGRYLDFHHTSDDGVDNATRLHTDGTTDGELYIDGSKVWHAGNDGGGSGLDADLLDGQQGTFYQARANHTGTQPSSTISDFDEAAQDAVGAMAGTGLTYTDATPDLSVTLSPFSTSDLSEGSNLYFTDERVDDRVAALVVGGTNIVATYNDVANTLTLDVSPQGGGSGLDADTLDGLENTAFLRSDADDTATGLYQFIRASATNQVIAEFVNTDDGGAAEVRIRGHGQGDGRLFVGQSGTYGGGIEYIGDGTGPANAGGGADRVTLFRRNAGVDSAVLSWSYSSGRVKFEETPFVGTDNIWHAGNDGAGSGLDADLLDGQHGAFYQDASNLNAGILPAARFNDTAHGNRGGGSLHALVTTGAHGFMSSTDKSKLDGIESGATADQTAADIRALGFFDTSNDGSGSGLDADLLDGIHAASFLRSDVADTVAAVLTFQSTNIPVYDTHPSFTNDLEIVDKKYVDDNIQSATTPLRVEEVDGAPSIANVDTLQFDQAKGFIVSEPVANTARVSFDLGDFSTTDLPEGTNLYYTDERVDDRVAALIVAGNQLTSTYDDVANTLTLDVDDGAGSGLDADTVDALQASQFLRSDTADQFGGTLTPDTDNTHDVGSATNRVANLHATQVHTGDLVMHDPVCVDCNQPFEKGDRLRLEVIAVEGPEDDRALRTVPVHDSCHA